MRDALWQELARLHAKWRIFKQLFGTSTENVELLNRAAVSFAGVVQDSMVMDLFVSTGRLLDPPRSVGKENLSLPGLLAALHGDDLADLRARLEALIADAQSHYSNAKQHRNRRLAHSDLQTLLRASDAQLPAVSRREIESAINGVAACLNEVDASTGRGRTQFTEVIQPGDGDALLRVLKSGLDAQEEHIRRKREAAGLPPDKPAV